MSTLLTLWRNIGEASHDYESDPASMASGSAAIPGRTVVWRNDVGVQQLQRTAAVSREDELSATDWLCRT
jgi:hypothetical protein